MTVVRIPITAPYGGVSRQPAALRHPNQVQDSDNASFSVADGFSKRPGTHHIKAFDRDHRLTNATYTDATKRLVETGAFTNYTFTAGDKIYISAGSAGVVTGQYTINSKIDNNTISLTTSAGADGTGVKSGFIANASYKMHVIDRDANERYLVVYGTDMLRVFDLDGAEAVVTWNSRKTDAARTYFRGTGPNDLVMTTSQDTTLIANKTATPAVKAAPTHAVTSTRGNYSNMVGGGAETIDTVYETLARNRIEAVVNTLEADRPMGFWQFNASSAYVDGNGFTLVENDDEFTRVPQSEDPDAELDAATSPIRMTRTSLSPLTFDVDLVQWTFKWVGRDLNPAPDIWTDGRKISDLVFHRNRLAIAADEQIMFSQSGDFFNYYLEDPLNLIDSDPISAPVSTDAVALMDHLVPFRNSLLAFTKSARQFQFTSEILKPGAADFKPTTTYHTVLGVRPVTMGHLVYFPTATNETGLIYEYLFDEIQSSNIANDITKHVFRYIPPDIRTMLSSPNNNTVVVLMTDDPFFYTYKTHWVGAEKVQSAWGRHTLESTERIVDAVVLRDDIYLLIEMSSGYVLERLSIPEEVPAILQGNWYGSQIASADFTDYTSITNGEFTVTIGGITADVTGINFTGDTSMNDVAASIQTPLQAAFSGSPTCQWKIDRFVVTSDTVGINSTVASVVAVTSGVGTDIATLALMGTPGVAYSPQATYNPRIDRKIEVTGTYNAATNETTWDYVLNDPTINDVVLGRDFGAMSGSRLSTTRVNSNSIKSTGDFSFGEATLGRSYTMTVQLSEQFVRANSGEAILDGRLILKEMIVQHQDSGAYTVRVSQSGRTDRDTQFLTIQVGVDSVGVLPVDTSGETRALVMGDAQETTISIINDTPLPGKITGIEILGEFVRQSIARS